MSKSNDQEIEAMIQERGLTAPRINPSQIEDLMGEVQYIEHVRPLGSTTTLVHAFLWGTFYLATGKSHSVSAENYNAEVGIKIAKDDAEEKARNALWDFEGYRLKHKLHEAPAVRKAQ